MSRLTAADIIERGEYLNPEFDPASLTVPQLMGVLGYHNIHAPSPYTKTKLVQIFYDEITAKSAKLKRERLKKTSSKASDDGITDGVTGQPLSQETAVRIGMSAGRKPAGRKSSATPSTDVVAPVPRRRSSVQPQAGRSAHVSVQDEDSDEDVLLLAPPPIKAPKKKKPRISTEDSGWEDNNIFQSGAESSSPSRPPKPPRKSSAQPEHAVRKAPKRQLPQLSPPSSPRDSPPMFVPARPTRQEYRAPPSRFSLPPQPVAISKESDEEELDFGPADTTHEFADQSGELEVSEDEDCDSNLAVQNQLVGGEALVRPAPKPKSLSWLAKTILVALSIPVLLVTYVYKTDSAFIGYCDRGSNTNTALEGIHRHWMAVEQCNKENSPVMQIVDHPGSKNDGQVDTIPCPPPALAPFLHPSTCTLCPEHGTCSAHKVTCDTGYILRPHPILGVLEPLQQALSKPTIQQAQSLIAESVNGLPGLGPIALPARCVRDPQRKRLVGALGQAVEKMLAQERGIRLCSGVTGPKNETAGQEAKRWGLELEVLRQKMKPDDRSRADLINSFDDTFNEAMRQLIEWGGIVIGQDETGKRYVAHKTPYLSWDCSITVRSREFWNDWQKSFYGLLVALLTTVWLRVRRSAIKAENKRVAELVEVVLDALRNRELQHHTDPVTTPYPYISSLQLRDRLLEKESIAQRNRLWEKVERSVESNANVRASLQEVRNAGELRVWTWVGAALDW